MTIVKGESIRPREMTFLHEIDNNIFNSGALFSDGYQNEYEN